MNLYITIKTGDNGMIWIGIVCCIISLALLIGVMLEKASDVFNPIKKDNSDYRFIEVDNVKTRNIFQ